MTRVELFPFAEYWWFYAGFSAFVVLLLLLDLETHPPRDAIRSILARAEPTPSRVVQFLLLDPAQPSPERLAETMARLHAWTAAGRGGAAALLDTHRPGAFALGTFAPGPFAASRAGTAGRPPRVALRAFRPPLPADGRFPVTATFTAPGSYVLRVLAHDGGLQSAQDVAIQVTPAAPASGRK